MEYLNERGEYAEPPITQMLETFQLEYPNWHTQQDGIIGDFDTDVSIETAS